MKGRKTSSCISHIFMSVILEIRYCLTTLLIENNALYEQEVEEEDHYKGQHQ